MECLYLLLVLCILLLLCLFLKPSRGQIKENAGLDVLNSLAWQNKAQCWDGQNSQGCTVPHRLIF